MPWLSVRLLRLSLAALVTGAFLGGWRLAGLPTAADWIPRLRSAHVHLMLFGWLLPFVLGVGYWILPRHPGSDQPRGSPRRAHAGAALLAAGIAGGAAGILPVHGTVRPIETAMGESFDAQPLGSCPRHHTHGQ